MPYRLYGVFVGVDIFFFFGGGGIFGYRELFVCVFHSGVEGNAVEKISRLGFCCLSRTLAQCITEDKVVSLGCACYFLLLFVMAHR